MARLLILDTALDRCAVCIMDGERRVACSSEEMQRGHAERLFPMIAGTLAQAGCAYSDLDRIAVAAGPGNFTGIRIGISAARGIALALGIPAVGVSVLEALAEEAGRSHMGDIAVANLGPRASVYSQRICAGGEGRTRPLSEPEWTDVDEISCGGLREDCLCVGSAAMLVSERCGTAFLIRTHPEFEALASVAGRRDALRNARPAPVYVRPPDARPRSQAGDARRSA